MDIKKDIFLFFIILFSGLFLGIMAHEAYHFFSASGDKEICLVLPADRSKNLFEVKGIQTELGANETNAMIISIIAAIIWTVIAKKEKII